MIEVRNLTKTYGAIKALRGIDFEVDRGEIVGFLGPNGAGKSTTMKIITCSVPQTAGSVSVDGHDINEASLKVRKKIGYLPESNPLYTDMLVYDYLAYVARIRGIRGRKIRERITRVSGMTGITERAGQLIGTLSKGFKQRVGLAQALIHDPDILILDEPTSGLDPNQIVEIRNLIKTLGKDHTVILSTHNLPEVMATCDRMIIVHQGALVADGTAAELQAREEDNPHVKVLLRGVEADTACAAIAALGPVEAAEETITAEADAVAIRVTAAPGEEVRDDIYRLAVERDWMVLEMYRDVLSLEGIFRKLTREV